MKSLTKLEWFILAAVSIIILAVWAMNGYEDTWLYMTALIIAIPTSWFYFGKKDK